MAMTTETLAGPSLIVDENTSEAIGAIAHSSNTHTKRILKCSGTGKLARGARATLRYSLNGGVSWTTWMMWQAPSNAMLIIESPDDVNVALNIATEKIQAYLFLSNPPADLEDAPTTLYSQAGFDISLYCEIDGTIPGTPVRVEPFFL